MCFLGICFLRWKFMFRSRLFFGCAGSSLLHLCFLWWWRGAVGLSLQSLLLLMEHGLWSVTASVVVAYGLNCPEAYGISVPGQEWNPCPLHWEVDSYHWTTRKVLCLFFFLCCCLSLSFNTINEVMWRVIKEVFCCWCIFRKGITLMDILFPIPFFFFSFLDMYSRNCLSSLSLF